MRKLARLGVSVLIICVPNHTIIYLVICDPELYTDEDQLRMEKCGVLNCSSNNLCIKRIACRTTSASLELLVLLM